MKQAVLYKAGVAWTADDNIQDARAASAEALESDVDLYSWWCNSGGGGVAGIAYVGTTCNSNGYQTSLNEYQGSMAGAGFVSNSTTIFNFPSIVIICNQTGVSQYFSINI